jgi:hypothetical protein
MDARGEFPRVPSLDHEQSCPVGAPSAGFAGGVLLRSSRPSPPKTPRASLFARLLVQPEISSPLLVVIQANRQLMRGLIDRSNRFHTMPAKIMTRLLQMRLGPLQRIQRRANLRMRRHRFCARRGRQRGKCQHQEQCRSRKIRKNSILHHHSSQLNL